MLEIKNPFGPDVSDADFKRWLAQFALGELPAIQRLLENFRYFSSSRVFALCRDLYTSLPEVEIGKRRVYVPAGYVAKSGSAIAYFFKTQNGLSNKEFMSFEELISGATRGDELDIVLIDDFLGTGRSAIALSEALNARFGHDLTLTFAVLAATQVGSDALLKSGELRLRVADPVLVLSSLSQVFDGSPNAESNEATVAEIGARAHPELPLGYRSSSSLVAFFYSTPNNTLPIFWSPVGDWVPLFPHAGSVSDDVTPATATSDGPQFAEVDLSNIDERFSRLSASPEASRQLFAEFQLLDLASKAADLLARSGINESTLIGLLSLIDALKVHEHEQSPVASTLVVSPTGSKTSETVCFAAREGLNVTDLEASAALAEFAGADGFVAIAATGEISGIAPLPIASRELSHTLCPRALSRFAELSKSERTVVFHSNGRGRAALFGGGELVASFRDQTWHVPAAVVPERARVAGQEVNCSSELLSLVYSMAASLSDEGAGALLTVGDHENVLAHCAPPGEDPVAWHPFSLFSMDESLAMAFLSADGASVLDSEGTVQITRATLRVPPGVKAVEEPGRGTKHRTAAQISAITNAISFAISVDGRISVYASGEKIDTRYG